MEEKYEEFLGLVDRVKAIDRSAAEWLMDQLTIDSSDTYDFQPDGELLSTMYFRATPQGFDYWETIAVKLGEW